jgi:hypothetical protein
LLTLDQAQALPNLQSPNEGGAVIPNPNSMSRNSVRCRTMKIQILFGTISAVRGLGFVIFSPWDDNPDRPRRAARVGVFWHSAKANCPNETPPHLQTDRSFA